MSGRFWKVPAGAAERPRLLHVALLLVLVMFGLSAYFTQDVSRVEELRHLGAEYFNIAQALVDGRGYSDPFGEATGPTAWMPPAYTLLLAVLLAVFKSKNAVAVAVICLQNLALAAMGTAVYAAARSTAARIPALASVGLYLLWVLCFHYWFFVVTTDVLLIACLATLMMHVALAAVASAGARAWVWGLLAGAATLVNPALALAWVGVTALLFLRAARPRKDWLVAVAVACTVASPWLVRNAATFHRFIPTKSNLGYELYLANVVDEDGMYDNTSVLRHPYHFLPERFDYARRGESAYVTAKREQFVQAFKANPMAFVRRIGNRVLAATVLYEPSNREYGGLVPDFVRRIVYAFPALLLALGLALRGPHRARLAALGVLLGLVLLPYVVVAFYARYLFPLTAPLVLVCFLGLDTCALRLAQVRQRALDANV